MEREWFKCDSCGRECDNSVLAPQSVPGEEARKDGWCMPCFKSYCEVCDSLLASPAPAPLNGGYIARCHECGNAEIIDAETARNIVEIHSKEKRNETI